MKWKPYPSYMNSTIQSLGSIPEGWEYRRLHRVLARVVIKNDDGAERPMLSLSAYRGVEVKEYEEEALVRPKEENLMYNIVAPGQLVVNPMWVINSGIGVSFLSGIVSPAYRVYEISPDLDPHYIHYLLKSSWYISQYNRYIRGLTTYDRSVREDDFFNIEALIPTLPEQRAIAAFLDRETARIDALIAAKERQIALLQEKRAALISHAVTKGLDPSTPMKDSGVEWLGEIPVSWQVIRVKALEGNASSVVQTGPFGAQLHASDYVEDGVPLILIRNVADLQIQDTNIPRVNCEDAERLTMYRLQVGDIVFSRVGSIGRIALCTDREEGWLISGQMLRLRIRNPQLNSRFSMYAFSSTALLTFVDLQSVGSTRESINTDILRNMPIPVPPLQEQRIIAAFLDRKTEQINILVGKVQDSIETLREYRTALISAAVTGKIDVRGKGVRSV